MKKVVLIGILILPLFSPWSFGAESRPNAGSSSYLSLNGVFADRVLSWQGGQLRGIVSQNGTDKRITELMYDPVVLEIGAPLSLPLTDLVDGFFAGEGTPATLLITTERAVPEVPSLEANGARLIRVECPALDGADKNAVSLRLTFAIARSTTPVAADLDRAPSSKRKSVAGSNFQMSIDGLPSQRIASVSAWSFSREGTNPSLTNITLMISAADKAGWVTWRDQFLNDQNGDGVEKNGKLSLMNAAMTDTHMTFTFSNIGLISLDTVRDDTISRVKAELYVEGVRLVKAPGVVAVEGEPLVAPRPQPENLRPREEELVRLQVRQKSLIQEIAMREAEQKRMDPEPKLSIEQGKFPAVRQQIDDPRRELAKVNQTLKAVQEETDGTVK